MEKIHRTSFTYGACKNQVTPFELSEKIGRKLYVIIHTVSCFLDAALHRINVRTVFLKLSIYKYMEEKCIKAGLRQHPICGKIYTKL